MFMLELRFVVQRQAELQAQPRYRSVEAQAERKGAGLAQSVARGNSELGHPVTWLWPRSWVFEPPPCRLLLSGAALGKSQLSLALSGAEGW